MKHTLKTLLLTTLLAVPTVFGADDNLSVGITSPAEPAGALAVACKSNFNKLMPDTLSIIIGYRPDEANPTRDENGVPVEWLGFAGNLETLLALSRTSKAFNKRAKPLIAVCQSVIRSIVDPFFPNSNNAHHDFRMAARKLFNLGAYISYISVWKKSAELFPANPWMVNVAEGITAEHAKGVAYCALSIALLGRTDLPSDPINTRQAIERAILSAKAFLLRAQGLVIPDNWKIQTTHPAGRGRSTVSGYTPEGVASLNAAMSDDQMLRALWNRAQSERYSFMTQ